MVDKEIDYSLDLTGTITDIDILPKVTRLKMNLPDRLSASLVLSNDFIEKLAALIVMIDMINLPNIAKSNRDGIQQRVDKLKKDIFDNYGKTIFKMDEFNKR